MNERQIAYQKAYQQTEAYRDALARYHASEKWQIVKERYRTSPVGRAKAIGYMRAARAANPEKAKARNAVNNALKAGHLTKPVLCSACGLTPSNRMEAHHPRGYGPDHRLDVDWLCTPCHKRVHGR